MKHSSTSFLVVFFTSFSSAQTDFQFRKDHDALQVMDLDLAAKFYQNILGLEEIPNGGLGDHIRWFQLEDKVQVHLIESKDRIEKHKGVHLAMNTPHMSEFMEHLKKNEVHYENWNGEKGTSNTRPDGVKQIYFQDPDGYWIEVNDGEL